VAGDGRDNTSDEEIMLSWYAHAADEPGFVGYWLGLLRERQGVTTAQQQTEFGADVQAFLRLQAMPSPRTRSFARDAHRIAETCNLRDPMAFVQAMLIARNLDQAAGNPDIEGFYQAAFDEEDLE
jgi:hypothetical protein